MKPRVKNDSWCYTASKTAARRRVKRLSVKRHRQEDRKILREGGNSPCFLSFEAKPGVKIQQVRATRKNGHLKD
jgi:hypothetical protein